MYLHLPATIDALAHANDPTGAITAVVSPELTAPTFCAGYVPVCDPPTSQGAYYSALCTDIAPFTDATALASLAGGEAAWTQDYVDGPYNDVCEAWQVEPADDAVTAALKSDVPVLVFGGGLDPTVSPDAIRSGIAGLPNASVHRDAGVGPRADDDPTLPQCAATERVPCGPELGAQHAMSGAIPTDVRELPSVAPDMPSRRKGSTNMKRSIGAILVVAMMTAACESGSSTPTSGGAATMPTSSIGSLAPEPILGTWRQEYTCEKFLRAFTRAGLGELGPQAIVDFHLQEGPVEAGRRERRSVRWRQRVPTHARLS